MAALVKRRESADEDAPLFAEIAAGDDEAFAVLVRHYGARFYTVARRMLGNERDAEDAVQTAFFHVYRSAGAYRQEWGGSTWLYRILTNVCIDQWRKRRRLAEVPEREAVSTAAPVDARRIDLERALRRLPAEARAIFLLCYAEDLSYGEIARARGISVNTVKTQLRRAKQHLRKHLKEVKT